MLSDEKRKAEKPRARAIFSQYKYPRSYDDTAQVYILTSAHTISLPCRAAAILPHSKKQGSDIRLESDDEDPDLEERMSQKVTRCAAMPPLL